MGVPAVSGAGGVEIESEKEMPVPESERVCVAGEASSVTVKVAGPRGPAAAGVNVRLMVQLAAGATVDPFVQVVPVVATAKSAAFVPLIATVAMCNVEPPGFVTVIDEALLVVPTPWLPNVIGVLGESVAAGGVTPVRVTVCVEPETPLLSSVNVSVAVLLPAADGVKVTLQVQVPFVGATVEPLVQVVPPDAMAKSPAFVPVIATVAK